MNSGSTTYDQDERQKRQKPNFPKCKVMIKIDIAGARRYMETARANVVINHVDDAWKTHFIGKTDREIISRYLLLHVMPDTNDAAVRWATVEYKNCEIGTHWIND